jgi:ATP-dependent DNA helicase PIF1
MAPKRLQLRRDAQVWHSSVQSGLQLLIAHGKKVMMIKNIDDQLVNGTVGKVVDFMTEEEWLTRGQPEPPAEDKEKPAKKTQTNQREYPIIEWKIIGSRLPRTEIVREETFKIEGPNGTVEVSRIQVSDISVESCPRLTYALLSFH